MVRIIHAEPAEVGGVEGAEISLHIVGKRLAVDEVVLVTGVAALQQQLAGDGVALALIGVEGGADANAAIKERSQEAKAKKRRS